MDKQTLISQGFTEKTYELNMCRECKTQVMSSKELNYFKCQHCGKLQSKANSL